MSRLSIHTLDQAQRTVESLYRDLERRIVASPPGLCPVDLASSFLKMCHAQTCGKCVPCRVGLAQLGVLLDDVLEHRANPDSLKLMEKTAQAIYNSADCAIGYEAARMVLNGLRGFRLDYEEHVLHHRCTCELNQPVPCVALCPAGVDIPGYIALVAEGRYSDAVELIRKDNPMPSVCALICEHPCEARCRRNMLDDSINIRGLKRYAIEHENRPRQVLCNEPTDQKVAIVGGGPSGLSAAYYLAMMGHEVTIFEQRKRLGGMLRYGIPNYRLPRVSLDSEIETILAMGVSVKTEVTVGSDVTIDELRHQFDAVYIAIGAHIDRKIGVAGEEAPNVISAVEVLRAIGDDEYPDFTGQNVIVIGGGNVAMDVARSAVRLGASKVTIVYRRRRHDMTALDEEIEGAVAESCEVFDLHTPRRIECDDSGHAVALWVQPQIIGRVENGRPSPANADSGEMRLSCDVIIIAIGQGIEAKPFEEQGIPIRRGVIEALRSSSIKDIPGVYAGGDCVTGPATVIRAIAAGKVAAANIDEYLGFNHVITTNIDIPAPRLDDRPACGRVNMKERPAAERVGDFEMVECGMSCEEAQQESRRCLRCDHFGYGVFKGGRVSRW